MSDQKVRERLEGIRIYRLPSGYYHLRGYGPGNWAQPPTWPCDEATLRAHTFPGASEQFIREMLAQIEAWKAALHAPEEPSR